MNMSPSRRAHSSLTTQHEIMGHREFQELLFAIVIVVGNKGISIVTILRRGNAGVLHAHRIREDEVSAHHQHPSTHLTNG